MEATAGYTTPPTGRATRPMEVTPGRRPRDAGQGITPMAKRPMERTIAPEQNTATMSIEQMSGVLSNTQRQYEADMRWIMSIAEAVTEHAARLDHHRNTYKDIKDGGEPQWQGVEGDGLGERREYAEHPE